jgi:peptidoglycan-associated lipoprotein
MITGNAAKGVLVGSVMVAALLGFTGCAKKAQVQPAAEEVGGAEEAYRAPAAPVTGGPGTGLSEESLQAKARAELEAQLGDIHFDYDKYNIRPDARAVLKRNFDVIRKATNVSVLIEGHCDERGTVEYNLALGQRRANAARDYLVGLGMTSGQLSTISYGKERPLDPGHDEEAWAKNRRCHFSILK